MVSWILRVDDLTIEVGITIPSEKLLILLFYIR